MINKVQCPEGHFYNANKFEECPVCNPDTISSQQTGGVQAVNKAETPAAVITPVTQGPPKEQEKVVTSAGKHKSTFSLFSSRNKQEKDVSPNNDTNAISQSIPAQPEAKQPEPVRPEAKQSIPVQPEPEPMQVVVEIPKQPEPVRPEPMQHATAPPVYEPSVPPVSAPPVPAPPAPVPPMPELPKPVAAPEPPVIVRVPPEQPKPVAVPAPSLQEAVNNVVNHTDTEDVKTMAMWSAPTGNEPVVGWLVSIKGEYIGQSFNLKAGNNTIGRSMEMDIALAQEMKVSRNRHCIITYEPDNQEFYLQQGDSSGLTYLNKKMVMTPQIMEAGDLMKIGDAEFIFVPFCVDGFSWEAYLN
ncbi:MAG: FHA domain-containing protein [Oscillospiraceae bacterium]|nr:FHA domain-containing protein [Oscillospiraceae bacterium]